jgi:hypothetical protein
MLQKICKNCASQFEITEKDLEFYEKISPIYRGEKYRILPPTLCPTCRMQRRQAFRNDRSLYKSTSSLSGKPIVSMYNPKKGFTVYEYEEWWSGKWDPTRYGKDFDPNNPFFKQFEMLRNDVPRFNLFNKDTENCDFVNYAPHCKNCYLLFGSWFNEDCCYGQTLNECTNCIDNLFLDRSQMCYENIDCNNNYHSFFCQNCNSTRDSFFCYDCKNIENCIGCFNLKDKKYHIENKPVAKEEYERIKSQLGSYQALISAKSYFTNVITQKAIHKAYIGLNNEDVSGDFIFNCKNAKYCFSVYRSQDVAYSGRMFDQKDTYDFEGGGKGELLYENMSNDFGYFSIGCTTCEYLTNSHYCDLCFNCKDCFGCVGLNKKQYCVLNKQYTKEEYEELVSKIIKQMESVGEWGEFFPFRLSPFGYNETMAQEYFPLAKEVAIQKGFNWSDYEQQIPQVEKTICASELPDSIGKTPDDILNWAILCEITNKPYLITKQELKFYKTNNLPIPRRHPNQRHADRMAARNPRHIWDGKCAKCGDMIKTTYAPGRPEIIYCEKCYLGEMY